VKQLWLQRHCEPTPGHPMDSDRQLTEIGVKQANDMGDWLRDEHGRVDIVITSPFKRAAQTAKIMAEKLGSHVADTRMLEPDGKPEEIWKEVERLAQQSADVLIVGHDPSINALLLWVLGLSGAPEVRFEHGSIAHVHFKGGAKLRWLVSPKLVVKEEQAELEEAAIGFEEAFAAAQGIVEADRAFIAKISPVSDLEDGGYLWQVEPV
jgi:phosphohistidine phosphatase